MGYLETEEVSLGRDSAGREEPSRVPRDSITWWNAKDAETLVFGIGVGASRLFIGMRPAGLRTPRSRSPAFLSIRSVLAPSSETHSGYNLPPKFSRGPSRSRRRAAPPPRRGAVKAGRYARPVGVALTASGRRQQWEGKGRETNGQ